MTAEQTPGYAPVKQVPIWPLMELAVAVDLFCCGDIGLFAGKLLLA